MKILYVYANPNPLSFNGELKNVALATLSKQHDVLLSDLYAEHFNPVASWNDFTIPASELSNSYLAAQQTAFREHKISPDIQTELNKIKEADHLIFQFPLWWFAAPAILKGWLDRNLIKGFAYDTGKIFKDGLLQGKSATLVVTTQSPESAYQTNGSHGATMDDFLHPIHHTLRFTGMKTLSPYIIYQAYDLDKSRSQQILGDYQKYLKDI